MSNALETLNILVDAVTMLGSLDGFYRGLVVLLGLVAVGWAQLRPRVVLDLNGLRRRRRAIDIALSRAAARPRRQIGYALRRLAAVFSRPGCAVGAR